MGNLLQNVLALHGAAGAGGTLSVPIALVWSLGTGGGAVIPNQGYGYGAVAAASWDALAVGSPSWAATGGPLYSANYVAGMTGSAIGDGGAGVSAVTGSKHWRVPSIETLLDLLDADGLTLITVGKRGAAAGAYAVLTGAKNAANNRGFNLFQDGELSPGYTLVNGSRSVSVDGASGSIDQTYNAAANRTDGLWAPSGRFLGETQYLSTTRANNERRIEGALQVVAASTGTSAGAINGTGTADWGIGCLYNGTTAAYPVNHTWSFVALIVGKLTAAQQASIWQGAYRTQHGVGGVAWDFTPANYALKSGGSAANTERDIVTTVTDPVNAWSVTQGTAAKRPTLVVASNHGVPAVRFIRNLYQASGYGSQEDLLAATGLTTGIAASHFSLFADVSVLSPQATGVPVGDIISFWAGGARMGGICIANNYIKACRGAGSVYLPTAWAEPAELTLEVVRSIRVGLTVGDGGMGAARLHIGTASGSVHGAVTLAGGSFASPIDEIRVGSAHVGYIAHAQGAMRWADDTEFEAYNTARMATLHAYERAAPRAHVVHAVNSIPTGYNQGATGCSGWTTPGSDDPDGVYGRTYFEHLRASLIACRASHCAVGYALTKIQDCYTNAGISVTEARHWRTGRTNALVSLVDENNLNSVDASSLTITRQETLLTSAHALCTKKIVRQATTSASDATKRAAFNAALPGLTGITYVIDMTGAYSLAGELYDGDGLHVHGGSYDTPSGIGRSARGTVRALQAVMPEVFSAGGHGGVNYMMLKRMRARGRR